MTPTEFVSPHINRFGNGPISIRPIKSSTLFCPHCFDKDGELNQLRLNNTGPGWVCENWHAVDAQKAGDGVAG